MNIETLREAALALPGVKEDLPFGPDYLVFRLCGKIFACIHFERPQLCTLKCDADRAVDLRDRYSSIVPAWHWNKRQWNDVRFDADVSDAEILALLRHAYDEVRRSLPKKTLYNFPDLPPGFRHRHIPQCDTLMNAIGEFVDEGVEGEARVDVLTADFQTHGRGQMGNHWEAADGENLLLAMRFSPSAFAADAAPFPVEKSFRISQLAALSLYFAVKRFAAPDGEFQIKWPNDLVYHTDRSVRPDFKVGGILIYNRLQDKNVLSTTIGIGLNVNQTEFRSDAPNPLSLRQIAGREVDRAGVLRQFLKYVEALLPNLCNEDDAERSLVRPYHKALYRRAGMHRFRDARGFFMAAIMGVEPDGTLALMDDRGRVRKYQFKEVTFLPD